MNNTTSHKKLFIEIGLAVLVVAGLALGLFALSRTQDTRNGAWSGATVDTAQIAKIRAQQALVNNPITLTTHSDSQIVFQQLLKQYPQAQVQDISVPSQNITGRAYSYYDAKVNKTVIFSRIENMPEVDDSFLHSWIIGAPGTNGPLKAGIAEFDFEQGKQVAYMVFSQTGDLTHSKQMLISYDLVSQRNQPGRVVATLNF